MNGQIFSLLPFPADDLLSDIKIGASVVRRSNTLVVSYVLQGTLTEVVIPEQEGRPIRKNNLWEGTCFEFFLGVKGFDQYWEFNLSPAGHWNVYRFEAYRQGMQEDAAFMSLPLKVRQEPDALRLGLEIDLANIIHAEQALEVAVSAVIKLKDGRMEYWAVAHSDDEPDFHQRDSFVVAL